MADQLDQQWSHEAGKASGSVALITGTNSGFGLLTSIALAKDGYQVISTMRNTGKGDTLRSAAGRAGVTDRIDIMEMDVTNETQVRDVVERVVARYGRIDVLINNAGYAAGGLVEEVALSEWRRQFETNVFGVLACTQAVLPCMREQGAGRIVTVSSISGRIAMPGLGPYSASKFALEGMMESLRFEVARYGISVVLIEPGPYQTNVWENSLRGYQMDPDSPYSDTANRLYKQVQNTAKSAGDPMEVVGVIRKVLRHRSPKFRYPVGKGMRLALTARKWLPWRLFERVVQSQM